MPVLRLPAPIAVTTCTMNMLRSTRSLLSIFCPHRLRTPNRASHRHKLQRTVSLAPLQRNMSTPDRQAAKFLTKPDELGIVAASCGLGQLKHGVEFAPQTLMGGKLPDLLRRTLGLRLFGNARHDACGPLHKSLRPEQTPLDRAKQVSEITRSLSRWAFKQAIEGRLVLTLGGDHSIAIGSVSGVASAIHQRFDGQKKLGVIWIDAHADINIPETSTSGNVHGMSLAFLSGLARSTASGAFDWIADQHRVGLDKLVYIGLRDLDDYEKDVLKKHSVKYFTPFDVTHLGIKDVMDQTFAHLGSDIPIHLGFDIDGLDPTIAPSTGMPVPGGLTLREGQYIAERVSRSGQLVSMDMVEINPRLGSDQDKIKTLEAANCIIKYALGGSEV